MPSPSDRAGQAGLRVYNRGGSVVFLKTHEEFGGLSNMAGGFPLTVNRLRILTVEALYQACRFPHRPELQRLIIGQRSPMTAKMKSLPHRHESRPDWDRVRVKVMRWCLRVKLAQNWTSFSDLLLRTGNRPIVEYSSKDDFWGAKEAKDGMLRGRNVLGRLLMEVREAVRAGRPEVLLRVEPLEIPQFLLDGHPIEVAQAEGAHERAHAQDYVTTERAPEVTGLQGAQGSLFGAPAVKEGSASYVISSGRPRLGLFELPTYQVMKGSGVPWLGEVPAHWEVRRLKSLAMNVVQRSEQCTGRDLYVALEHVEGWTGRLRNAGSQIAFDGQTMRFRSGDVLFGKLRPYLAKVTRPVRDGVCVTEFLVLRPRRATLVAAYLEHLLRSQPVIRAVAGSTFGAKMPRADWQFVGGMAIPLPPPPEQAAIVRFLGYTVGRIRRYIRTKEELIKLLEEQRQAIIHRAVTRGLEPDVRLRPSGVAWLGEVPEHWEISRVKTQFRCLNSRRVPLSATERGAMTLRRYDYYGASGVIDRVDDYLFDDNLLLIAEDGANLVLRHLPLAIIARGRFWVNNHAHILKPRVGQLEYLAGVMEALNYLPWISGAAQPKLTQDRLMSIAIAVPPRDEQERITASVTAATAGLRIAIERARSEMELLKELRTRLIADVVTGKLDVREAAAALPAQEEDDEAQEPEPGLGEIEDDIGEGDAEEATAEGAEA